MVSVSYQYLEPFNCVQTNDWCVMELLEVELFDHLTVFKHMTDV